MGIRDPYVHYTENINPIEETIMALSTGVDSATVVHALLTSRSDYCSELYEGLLLKTVWKLQLEKNTGARVEPEVGHMNHITPVLFHLHCLPSCFSLQFKMLVSTFKTLYGQELTYFKDHFLAY